MMLQIALLDLLKQEKELVDEINKTGYDATYYEKRAKEHKAGGTLCDMQAALDDLKKTEKEIGSPLCTIINSRFTVMIMLLPHKEAVTCKHITVPWRKLR